MVQAESHPDATFDDLIVAAKRGENWAWRSIHDELMGPITGYVRSRGANDPDDVAGDVFLSIARDIHNFEGDSASFRSWAFVIAHRRMLDARRAFKRRPVVIYGNPDDPVGGNVEDEAIDQIGSARVQKLLDQLTDEQRDVLALRVVADLSLKETAFVLGKGVGAVKALQRRAILSLKRLLEEGQVSL